MKTRTTRCTRQAYEDALRGWRKAYGSNMLDFPPHIREKYVISLSLTSMERR